MPSIPTGRAGISCRPDTPRANNLLSGGLLDQNPNTTQPFRLDRTCPLTSDQNHDYTPEQKAFDHGLMDAFVQQYRFRGNRLPDVRAARPVRNRPSNRDGLL